MVHLPDVVDPETLIALEPDELGLHIIQVLALWPEHLENISPQQLKTFTETALQGYGPTPHRSEIIRAILEAWAWLEGQALLIQDPRWQPGSARILGRRARRLTGNPKTRRALFGHRLPKETLHLGIREEVWALYQREKYDTAVFEAMKAVEVAVRDAAKLQPTDIGAPLMRRAFDVDSGALTDKDAVPAERQALSDLFAGAIGAYKNPHSHRNVVLDDPDEAAEIIFLANHLLRIVDARKVMRTAKAENNPRQTTRASSKRPS